MAGWLEEIKTTNSSNLERQKAKHNLRIEAFKGVFQFSGATLKSSIIINGGGAIALLAFIGKIWGTKEATALASSLTCPLTVFTFGVLSSAVAAGASYLGQSYYATSNDPEDHERKMGKFWQGTAIVLVIFSYILYAAGAIFTSQALSK